MNGDQTRSDESTSTEQQPLVVAVVLTWNDTELASNCLRSVFTNDYPNLQVVLVDNGSEPPCGPSLKAAFPDIVLVQNATNQGFSGGANRGLEKALELGADYVHLIGNDATLGPTAISNLLSACERDAKVCAAGPLLLDPGDQQVVQFFTGSLDRERTCHFHHHVGEVFVEGEWPIEECEFIPCVALFFRATALQEVGLFDESFGTCWEDYDLCIRMRDAGWKYVAVGTATAVHIGSYTTGRQSPYIVYHSTRNRLICISRYAGKGAWRKHLGYFLRSHWFHIKQYGLLNWSCHRAFVRAFIDYISDVHGERKLVAEGKIPGLT